MNFVRKIANCINHIFVGLLTAYCFICGILNPAMEAFRSTGKIGNFLGSWIITIFFMVPMYMLVAIIGTIDGFVYGDDLRKEFGQTCKEMHGKSMLTEIYEKGFSFRRDCR